MRTNPSAAAVAEEIKMGRGSTEEGGGKKRKTLNYLPLESLQ